MSNVITNLSGIRALFACFALMGAFLLPVAGAIAAKGNLEPVSVEELKEEHMLYVTLGKAELVDLEGEIADVLVADPAVIDVMAVQANRLYVVGLSIGDTNIIALDAQGEIIKRLDVHVKYDLRAIQSMVDSLFPGEDVTVGAVHDQIVLTGTASTPEQAAKIADIVAHYVSDLQDLEGTIDYLISNLMEVRGEQQVMLQVKIIEATRNVIRELGIETNFNDPDELATTTIFGTTPSGSTTSRGDSAAIAAGAGLALSQDPTVLGRILADTGIRGLGQMGLFINALEEENLVNVLAEPNLTTVSGQQAGFLAGGEYPVPTGRDQIGNIVIEFREFGVSLTFRPVVLSDDRISMQLNTEVSTLDFDNAVVLSDLTVPGRDIRRAETTVEIPSGGSLMIAGLLQSDAIDDMSGIPGISKAPVLGELMKSEGFQRNETELVVIVTPYLVEPYAEEDRADHVPEQEDNPLARAFAANIRRAFELEDEEIFALDQRFGYLLD